MVNLLQAIFLGIIQGLTEFFPISSSAHLILAPYFFSFPDPGLAFDVALHMGTLAAILTYFWKDWLALLQQVVGRHKPSSHFHTTHYSLVIIGTVPAAIFGLLFEKQAEAAFRNPILIACTLAFFGILLWFFDIKSKKNKSIERIHLKEAILIGCAQALAIIPGVSRSGITITTALALGFNRLTAMRFSFLLSAPIIAGAGVLKLKSIVELIKQNPEQASIVFTGFLASMLAGLAAIVFLNHLIKQRSFQMFGAYRVILALVVIIVIISR